MNGQATEPRQFRRKFYGRIQGKKLSPAQEKRLATTLPKLALTPPPEGKIELSNAFHGPDHGPGEFWLEIGFGSGEHLAHLAASHPGVNLIGSEIYRNGIASMLLHIEKRGLTNIRLFAGDARDLLDALADACLARIYLLYPDPWPKARHAKRRFISPDNLREFSRLMKAGAKLFLASDIPGYIEHALEVFAKFPEFEPVAHDIHEPWEGWSGTRYEAKATREGRKPHYVIFNRR